MHRLPRRRPPLRRRLLLKRPPLPKPLLRLKPPLLTRLRRKRRKSRRLKHTHSLLFKNARPPLHSGGGLFCIRPEVFFRPRFDSSGIGAASASWQIISSRCGASFFIVDS